MIASVFARLLAPGVIDENPAYGLGGGGEEVAAAVPGSLRPGPTSRR